MTSIAQKIVEEGENYSPIPQGPFKWLCQNVTEGACNLWVYLLLQPPGFNHYPKNVAAALNVNLRTIQRRIAELLKCGALLKVTRAQPGKMDIFYYRVLVIPKDYRLQKEISAPIEAPKPAPIETPPPVDNSCKRAVQKHTQTTNMSHLIRLNIKKYSNNTYPSHTHSHSIRAVQNSSNGNEYESELRKYFDLLISHYPAHKVPWHDKNYLQGCFKLFKQEMAGNTLDYIEMATEFCVNDIRIRLKHCYHWMSPEDIPSLWAYLKHRRWTLPIQFSPAAQKAARAEFDGMGRPTTPKQPETAPQGLTGPQIGETSRDWGL